MQPRPASHTHEWWHTPETDGAAIGWTDLPRLMRHSVCRNPRARCFGRAVVLVPAYYKIEPYELEMPAFPHIPRKRDHGFSSTLSLLIHCRKTNVHLHASFFSLNLSRTGGMASDSSSPFWKAFLLTPSSFEPPLSGSPSFSPALPFPFTGYSAFSPPCMHAGRTV